MYVYPFRSGCVPSCLALWRCRAARHAQHAEQCISGQQLHSSLGLTGHHGGQAESDGTLVVQPLLGRILVRSLILRPTWKTTAKGPNISSAWEPVEASNCTTKRTQNSCRLTLGLSMRASVVAWERHRGKSSWVDKSPFNVVLTCSTLCVSPSCSCYITSTTTLV